jgi:chitinase
VLGDTLLESTERFFLELSAATNATLLDALGLGTIVDDDSPPSDYQVSWTTTSVWDTGFNGQFTIQNTSSQTWTDWIIEFDHPFNITQIWNGILVSRVGNRYRVRAESWNRTLAPGASTTFGYQADPGSPTAPTNISVIPVVG